MQRQKKKKPSFEPDMWSPVPVNVTFAYLDIFITKTPSEEYKSALRKGWPVWQEKVTAVREA